MSGDLIPFDRERMRRLVERDLEALNEQAAHRLGEKGESHPAPAGCPAKGQWIRVETLDLDGRLRASAPWHEIRGWSSRFGRLELRCTGQTPKEIGWLIGDNVFRWQPRWRESHRLAIAQERPDDAVCRRCIASIEREANMADDALQAWRLVWYLLRTLPPVQIGDKTSTA